MKEASSAIAWFPVILALILASVAPARAASPEESLVAALRTGGHVLVMRHAHAPREAPAAGMASKDNIGLERELDAVGRNTAAGLGEALRGLRIPIGKVYSSPTYRAMQTARLAQLPAAEPVAALGDRSGAEGASWLRGAAAERPAQGTNTLLITHAPNVMGAFAEQGQGMSDGEMLVVSPDAAGGYAIRGRIPIEAWPAFTEKDQQVMVFDGVPAARPYPLLERVRVLDGYYARLREGK